MKFFQCNYFDMRHNQNVVNKTSNSVLFKKSYLLFFLMFQLTKEFPCHFYLKMGPFPNKRVEDYFQENRIFTNMLFGYRGSFIVMKHLPTCQENYSNSDLLPLKNHLKKFRNQYQTNWYSRRHFQRYRLCNLFTTNYPTFIISKEFGF